MTARLPWRSGVPVPVPAPPSDTAQLLAALVKARNEKDTLTQQLRDTARERDRYIAERDAARVMLAAASRQCAAGCDHAKVAADLTHTLYAQERVIAELQAVNEATESRGFAPRMPAVAVVPKQRRPR